MKLRLGAAVLTAALIPLAATTATPAHAGVDITPPEVGSCHDLTMAEAYEESDPDPAVACNARHTTATVAVVMLDAAPADWADGSTYPASVWRTCGEAYEAALGDNPKVIRRSAHSWFWFSPTRVQREAGALWVRCDVGLLGGDKLLPIPENLTLGGLPLPDSRAKCRKGKAANYAYTACSQAHKFRAKLSIKYPHASFPGVRRSKAFALKKCRARATAPFFYEWVETRGQWRNGYRHAVCLFQD